jgi:N-acetylneuraminic acid mutarotase
MRKLAIALALVPAAVALAACLPAPASSPWQGRAPATFARQEVSYVYSPTTGKLYLAGGDTTVQEAYDPTTNSWSNVAPLPAALDHIQAVELNGRIYYIGGLVQWPGPAVGTVYVYDPVANTFTTGTPMPAGRERGAGGVAVFGDKVYYAGGLHDGVAVPWFDVYDTVTQTWATLPDMPEARDHFHAAVVNGRFYAIGGRHTAINATTTVNQAFDIGTGSWITGLAPLPTARGGFATAALDTEILIIGGEGAGKTYNTVEAYNTTTNTWRSLAPMPTPRHGIQAAICNGDIYLADGGTIQGAGGATNVHEVFFPSSPAACGRAG